MVKGYVASKIGPNHTAELYGCFDNFEEIDFSVMPNQFVLKANHGWKMNILVKNKNYIYRNKMSLAEDLKKWLSNKDTKEA